MDDVYRHPRPVQIVTTRTQQPHPQPQPQQPQPPAVWHSMPAGALTMTGDGLPVPTMTPMPHWRTSQQRPDHRPLQQPPQPSGMRQSHPPASPGMLRSFAPTTVLTRTAGGRAGPGPTAQPAPRLTPPRPVSLHALGPSQAAAVHHRDLQYGHRAASYPGPIGPSAASCHSSGVPQPHPHGLPLPSTRAPAPTTTSYDSQPALQVAQAGTVRTLTAAEAAEFSKTLREVSTTLPEEKVVMDGNKLAMVYRLDVPESVYSVAPFATVCYSYDLAGLSLFSRVWLLVDILG